MKKKSKMLLSAFCILALSGCQLPTNSTPAASTTSSPLVTNSASSSSTMNSSSSSNTSSSISSSSSSSSSSIVETKAWDEELIELMETHIGEVIPYIQLDEESLAYTYYEDDYGYPIVAIYDESNVNLLTGYKDILVDSGYELYEHYDEEVYGYEINFYSKGNVILQYDFYPGDAEYPAGNEIYISLLELPDAPGDEYPDAWPADLISAYFNGVSVPSVPGVTNYIVSDYMEYIGFIAIECPLEEGMEENYIAALEAAGFTVAYDEELGQHYAVESTNSVQVDLYGYEGVFTILLSKPIQSLPLEWPEDLIEEYYGFSVIKPENANVLNVYDYYSYDETVVIEIENEEGLLEAYLTALQEGNYEISMATNASFNVECIRAINPEKTIRIDIMMSTSGIIIEIGHYVEDTPVGPETPAYTRESILSEMCVSLFGTSEDSYFYDESIDCYYTTAIFGSTYDIETVYSYILTILPDAIVYAAVEEPIIDSYNGHDQYLNVFYDEAQTVAVEVICYYHSSTYGYVVQISVYDFADYFTG